MRLVPADLELIPAAYPGFAHVGYCDAFRTTPAGADLAIRGYRKANDPHDAADHGSHHARIARFLIENQVGFVVAGHMGPPMVQMLGQMGIGMQLDASGEARSAAIAAAR
jgi:predicted Fe-Mo cluster-binding NifX family protein